MINRQYSTMNMAQTICKDCESTNVLKGIIRVPTAAGKIAIRTARLRVECLECGMIDDREIM